MTPRLRKFSITLHITASVGWIGAVIAFLALDVATLTSQNLETLRAAYLAMDLIIWWAIVPLALTALLTGLIMSIGTSWGLFQHYWVLFKLLLTIFSTTILLFYTQTISYKAEVAADINTAITDLNELGNSLLHSVGGLVVLLVILILSVYKPKGLTPYGWRRHQLK
ncbi:DUF2269 domain-containing protein [Alkalihalophilus pseudofirmus]|nr:DUF2269 domain-containing protein [Alkalihalophilus pseudofirmus]